MSEEWFDVVDNRDEVIGREKRSVVHKKGLLHRAVHILVWDPNGRIFLQKRSMRKDEFPGLWDTSSAGHLDAGETYDQSAVRELEEELGMKGASLKALFKIEACVETGMEFVWVYETVWSGEIKLDPVEIETGDWFTADEIDQWISKESEAFAPGFLKIWKRIRPSE